MVSIVDSESSSDFEGFTIENVRLAQENLDRVAQRQEENISDLDITTESESEDENEDFDADDHHLDQDGEASEWRNQLDPVQIDASIENKVLYLPLHILNMYKIFINFEQIIKKLQWFEMMHVFLGVFCCYGLGSTLQTIH